MSLNFPIPDWGEGVFNYPGVTVNGGTNIKKLKKRKRKHDSDGTPGTLKKGHQEDSEVPQQPSKKKKIGQTETLPEKKKNKSKNTKEPTTNELNNTKSKQEKGQTTEIFSHKEEKVQTEVVTKSLAVKRKKKRKNNNKYKELNEKQNEDKITQKSLTGDKSKSNQDITKTENTKELFKVNSSKKELQTSQGKELISKKKKKKKAVLLELTHDYLPQEDSTGNQKNSKGTSHQNATEDMNLANNHSQATSVNAKKKKRKSINNTYEIIMMNGDETQSCLEDNMHQKADGEKIKSKNKIKGEKSGEENRTGNGIQNCVSVNKSEKVSIEDETKQKKKKKKEKLKDNGNLFNDKDSISKPKKSKLKKQKSKGEDLNNISESEELIFDSNEECSEMFQKDLGNLLSKLDFNQFRTQGSKKEASNDNGITCLEIDNRQGMSETNDYEDSTNMINKGKGKSKDLKKKRKKMEGAKTSNQKINGHDSITSQGPTTPVKKCGAKFDHKKVAKLLEEAASIQREKPSPPVGSAETLKQKMEGRLMAARFRMVNQELYTKSSTEAYQLFRKDPAAFDIYHQGYQAQVRQWPVNPLDVIINWLSKKPKEWVVADMGCGEARLAQQVPQSCVHSLDLVAASPQVTACDMAHTPLATASVDVVVFCLSLMGTNLKDFMVETNRVLKTGGILKVAEVESRFGDVKEFEKNLAKYGFHCIAKDTSHQYFLLFEFKKKYKLKKTAAYPDIFLKPCLYKKR